MGFQKQCINLITINKKNHSEYQVQIQSAKSIKINNFLLALPAFCDIVTTTLQSIALSFIFGSIYQIIKGDTIITTFLFSFLILRTRIQRHQSIGRALAFLGVFIVETSSKIFSSGESGQSLADLKIIGCILMIISLFFYDFFFVFEQKLLSKYHLHLLEIVGYKGTFEVGFCLILCLIMSFIFCYFEIDACASSNQGFLFLEQPIAYFTSAISRGAFIAFCILRIFSITIYNVTGVIVTKRINALARPICDVTRTILVWGLDLIITATASSKYLNYKWQEVEAGPVLIYLAGFRVGILTGYQL